MRCRKTLLSWAWILGVAGLAGCSSARWESQPHCREMAANNVEIARLEERNVFLRGKLSPSGRKAESDSALRAEFALELENNVDRISQLSQQNVETAARCRPLFDDPGAARARERKEKEVEDQLRYGY